MSEVESFGQRIKSLRRELGLTQDELARRVGCAPVTLRKIEYDDLRPSVQIAERLAMSLNIALEKRAEFVRLARIERTPLVEGPPTPMPKPEEIGVEDLSGRAIRGYALGERIGKGGMGVIYRAMQPMVEREVAVKIILPQYANHPDFIRRFEAEAQLVARLEHPHIVPLYDYWREPNIAFLVMRLLRGGSLQMLLEDGPLPLEVILRIMEQIGGALGAAHRVGVIHRDLKPANILLDEEQNAYLADFGIAKNLGNPNLENLTQADVFIGSPAYVSPEQIRSEFVRPQSDIYCLGVVLFEMLTGQTPFKGPTPIDIMHQHLSAPLPPLAAHKAGLPRALDAVIERATAKEPSERYENTESLLEALCLAVRGEGITLRAATPAEELPPLTPADNPYKGLRAFTEGDAADFFGREALVQQLLIRMGEGGDLCRFLAVVGPSGSGKSSVVKAGLIPALRRGGLPGSEHWFFVDLLPGDHPFEEIEAGLLRIAVNPPESLLAQLREDKRGLLRAVRRCLPEDRSVELVLVIDQFEELFTLVQDEAERILLLDSLVTAILDERSRIRLMITLRADFTDRPLQYVDFGEILRQRMEIVLPMTPDELEQAILRPAERIGLQIEPELTAAILRDVEGQPGTLPLMEYTLTELFDQRENRHLTRSAYDHLGGVLGALGRRAEEVYAALNEEAQSTARQLFLRLVTIGEGADDTRRRVTRTELNALEARSSPNPIIEAFGRARLLAFDRDPLTRGPTVEVAHEALLREWARLRGWLDNFREDVRMQRLLAHESAEWLKGERDPSFLLAGARLAQFEGWAMRSPVVLTTDEHAYLQASLEERQHQQAEERLRQQRELETAQRLARTQRQRSLVLSFGLIVALILVAIALWAGRQANLARQDALIEADKRATQEAIAVEQARVADEKSQLSRSRELAAAAVSSLGQDPQLSLLLSIEAYHTAETSEAEAALHQAVQASHLQRILPSDPAALGASGALTSLAYSPDGSLLAAVNDRDWLQVFDTLSGSFVYTYTLDEELQALREDDPVIPSGLDLEMTVEFFPDGRLCLEGDVWFVLLDGASGQELLRGVSKQAVQVFDRLTGEEVFHFDHLAQTAHQETAANWVWFPISVKYTPAGVHLLVFSQNESNAIEELTAFDLRTGQQKLALRWQREISTQYTRNQLQYNRDGDRLALKRGDQVEIWDLANGELATRLDGAPLAKAADFAFSPDGAYFALRSQDNILKVWAIESGDEIIFTTAAGFQFSPNGQNLVVSDLNRQISVWSLLTRRAVYDFLCHPTQSAGALRPDGAQIAAGGSDGFIHLCEVMSDYELRAWTTEGELVNYAFAPLPGLLGIADKKAIRLYDVETGLPFSDLSASVDSELRQFDISYNGDRITFHETNYSWGGTGTSDFGHVIETATQQELAKVVSGPLHIDLSADGEREVVLFDEYSAVEVAMYEFTFLTNFLWMDWTPFSASAYGPGARFALAKVDGRVGVFSGSTQVLTATLGREPSSLAFSPDDRLLAAGTVKGEIFLLDAASGEILHVLPAQPSAISALAFSPDSRLLAIASANGAVSLWDARSGEKILDLVRHPSEVSFLAFTTDGLRLLSGDQNGIVRLSAVDAGELLTLAWQRLRRDWTGQELSQYHLDSTATRPPGGDEAAPAAPTPRAIILPTVPPPSLPASQLPNPPSEPITRDNIARMVDLGQAYVGWSESMAISPDGKFLAIVPSLHPKLINLKTLQIVWQNQVDYQASNEIAYSPDGKWIAIPGDDNNIHILQTTDGAEVLALKGHKNYIRAVEFSRDGKLLATGSYDKRILLWRMPDGALIGELVLPSGVQGLAISPDGAWLASGSEDGKLRIWNIEKHVVIREIQATKQMVGNLDISPDGQLIATDDLTNTSSPYAWRAADGAPLYPFEGYAPSFSPDGSMLLSWGFLFGEEGLRSGIYFWDAGDGSKITEFITDILSEGTFTPDQRYFLVVTLDGMLHIWGVP